MKGFNFEKDLLHQKQAVQNTVSVFENLPMLKPTTAYKHFINPVFDYQGDLTYSQNITKVQDSIGIDEKIKPKSNIIDIMMETGTGKTYTYTKTMFELNRLFGIFKFIVIVPTLSIKAGTIDFLKSPSCREHFKEQYSKTLTLHIVESQKSSKGKRSFLPPAVSSFVNAGGFEKNTIQVLIINAGMINSETMQKGFDRGLFDKYTVAFDAIAAIKPFVIIDEPHKFAQSNKTWENIQRMSPQFILRYGATFQGYENLIYTLTAVDAFNKNLVKGVIGHITEFEGAKNAIVKLIDSDAVEATFELIEGSIRKTVKVSKRQDMKIVHPQMTDLTVENLNKTTVVLSNGLELKRGDKINPYCYAQKLQESMIQKAIRQHFEIEKSLLTRDVRIKPLTLFFIDNIDEYRNKDGYIRKAVEQYAKAEMEGLLRSQTDTFYKDYLEKSLQDISAIHGGYFSRDNTAKDELIEREINEILHDKQAMLDLQNPRRFIFSKWTLREGWDNPNIFQICKLRSSGSEISKLQEVGRGLRLPVNEYGNRVKDEQFYLNYFVDFTESDFVDRLVSEINEKSGAISTIQPPERLTDGMIKKICEVYKVEEEELLRHLDENNIITRTNAFKEGGFEFIKQHYIQIFEGVHSNKVRKATEQKKKITVRTSKFDELKELWDRLNEKVILQYKIDNEDGFKGLLTGFLRSIKNDFKLSGISERVATVEIIDKQAVVREEQSVYDQKSLTLSAMKYSDFLKELSRLLNINIATVHQSIIESEIDINKYLNQMTLRILKQGFDHYLMANCFDRFSIEYQKVSNTIHPTKLTDADGNALNEILASDIGILFSEEKVAESYLFDELYYDSALEKENIKTNISEVIVFTKIPKESIKIPVAGGKSYSPDFAYVVRLTDGRQKMHFVVETKDIDSTDTLRAEERFKIKHAEKYFEGKVRIVFKTQFSRSKIAELINECYSYS